MALNAPTLQSSIAPFILLAPEVGIAPTSPRLQRGANLPQLLGESGLPSRSRRRRLVVPRGNAPRSSAYQAGALLLSYETSSNCGFEPNRRIGRKMKFGFVAGRIRMTRLGL